MPLHPQAAEFLARRKAADPRTFDEMPVAEARELAVRLSRLAGPAEPVARITDLAIAVQGGEIPLRVYAPRSDGPLPLYVFFHGGGWVVGNLETMDNVCRATANAADCAVVSVNYRHAPEHHFPVAAEDAYAATVWCAEHARELGADAERLAVGGVSAGGNLAAVVSLMARDRGGPRVASQVLTVPITDFSFDTPSYREFAEGYGLTRHLMQWFWRHYVLTEADGVHPYASPLRAADLSGLPPAFVMTAECDPLRDEGAAFARRLGQAGVEVTYRCYEGMVHGFLGPEAISDVARHLRALRVGTSS
jgi:acetyl esterase